MDLAQPLREKFEAQIDQVLEKLNGHTFPIDSTTFNTAIEWIRNFPVSVGEEKRTRLVESVCTSFNITEAHLYGMLGGHTLVPRPPSGMQVVEEFEQLLPKTGWFREYVEYTRQTEAPMSFHVFSSFCVLGAALGRRSWFEMGGLFRVYPNYRLILIGPTGKVHKTAALDVSKRLIHMHSLIPIFADKITPEALGSRLSENGGTQLMYAPEASVFLGKQRYNDGLITLLLRLLDDPEEFEIDTVGRGSQSVREVALSFMGGSTLSLLSGSSAQGVLSGGFLNRFVVVVEQDTSRVFPMPYLDVDRRLSLERTISRVRNTEGVFQFTADSHGWWDSWYRDFNRQIREYDETTAEALQRMPTHMMRTAMLIHIADCGTMQVCSKCFEQAKLFMRYVQHRMPQMVQAIEQVQSSADTEFVAETISRMGGAAAHSKLLNRCSYRMNVATMRSHIATLVEAKRVVMEQRGAMHFYVLKEIKK